MKKFLTLFSLCYFIISCTGIKPCISSKTASKDMHKMRDTLLNFSSDKAEKMNSQIATFLTFQKQDAEEAMNLYIDLFEHSEIITIKRWGTTGPGKEGTIMQAIFTLNGSLYMCSDSPAIHDWGFTPAVSNFVECEDEQQLEKLFSKLSENGKIMMPLNNYGFSQKFGFVEDKFGISWQLNLN